MCTRACRLVAARRARHRVIVAASPWTIYCRNSSGAAWCTTPPKACPTCSPEPVTAYIGFDPTASSLHVGSLLTMMGLARLQRFGHSPIAIVGGGTGMIGDPSGKSQERLLLSRRADRSRTSPASGSSSRDSSISIAPANAARIVNNADWLASFDLLAFLRDTGKYFTVNYMLQKESVSRRLESEEGISFTEFSYLLLQALRFPAAVRSVRLHAADGRQRSVGQHHRRHRSDSQAAREEGARPGRGRW